MPITEVQKQLRRKHLGATDAAPVLGLSPWKSAYDVWLEKTAEVADLEPTAAMDWGNRLEGAIIDATAERLGVKGRRNQRRVAANGIMATNLDFLTDNGLPLEVKASSQPDEWGPESAGLDGVPMHYAVQVLHQMRTVGAPKGYLGLFLMGFRIEHRIYEVVPEPQLLADLETRLLDWWNAHVITGKAPAITETCTPDMDTLRRVVRKPGQIVELDADLVGRWRALDEVAKTTVKAADALKAEIIAALGTADQGVSAEGCVTFFEQTRRGYVVDESTYRVLRFKKGGGM